MARNPHDLLNKVDKERKEEADRLEREIDRKMDHDYDGGEFYFTVSRRIHQSVINELKRRYTAWIIHTEEQSFNDPREPSLEYSTTLTFTPTGSCSAHE
jgi:hypothetical protein